MGMPSYSELHIMRGRFILRATISIFLKALIFLIFTICHLVKGPPYSDGHYYFDSHHHFV